MANVLAKLKKSSDSSPTKADPLRDIRVAVERADDARDIARDMLRRLPAYSASDDEITARHDAPDVHVHLHQHSEPDHDSSPTIEVGPVTVRGLPKLAIAAVGIVIAAITAAVSHFAAKGH